MLANYQINVNGLSNGNTITAPFNIEILKMDYVSSDLSGELTERLGVSPCTKNSANEYCANDDIADFISYDLPAMNTTKEVDLSNTFEATLNAVYGAGNWTKI